MSAVDRRRCALLAACLCWPLAASAAKSWLDSLLDTLGISSAPTQLRGEADAGTLCVVPLAGGAPVAWTAVGGLRSPVFAPAGAGIYALQGETLVRIARPGGEPTRLHAVPGVDKLVGFDIGAADRLLVLMADPKPPLAVLSVKSGTLAPVPFDTAAPQQKRLLGQIRGQSRTIGDTDILVQKQSGTTLAGAIEWTDIVARQAAGPDRNLSQCNGVDCSQPALSPDGARVVFVKGSTAE